MEKEVSIIIPAYNEKKGIADVIASIQKSMDGNDAYETLVVDDGSTDGTQEVLQGENVRLIQHTTNQGYGAALKTGIKNSKYRHIAIIDADGSYPAQAIPQLLAYMDDHDMVVGARIQDGAQIPLLRKPAKWALKKLAEYLTGAKIPDLNSGLRIFKKTIAKKYLNLLPAGFSFTSTITIAMLSNNYRVKYIPIEYYKRSGRSKIKPIRDTMNFIQLIIRAIMYFNPLKVFLPLSLTLFFCGIFVLLYSWLFTPQVMDITTIVLMVTSVNVAAIGLLADLIDKRIKR
jgi:glycosyltransferase involved in cell wall biosynthesis